MSRPTKNPFCLVNLLPLKLSCDLYIGQLASSSAHAIQ